MVYNNQWCNSASLMAEVMGLFFIVIRMEKGSPFNDVIPLFETVEHYATCFHDYENTLYEEIH